ncbi:nuclear matrix constituent protein 1-like protein [Dorcoceras hygrometricum]|uniref:Nuclear matrix constituent protein 1-like protein n=1 Tax=Dorcoceras hygrometricum TaxID=472368 RepID=A0A2Z7DI77_9LAMI|nr:nuclear matrix constituent protein 1-like protein [Dorcoceras hygrometricum]
MAPYVPRTRDAAALRMKQIALDNQSRMIRHLRAKLGTERRESAAIKEGLERRYPAWKEIYKFRGLVEAKKEHKTDQIALEASHKTIAGLTEIGLCMSKKIERMKAKKQKARESHMECHHKLQARIQETEDTIQEQHLIIEALVEEKASLLQTIQGLQEDNVAPAPFDDEWEDEPEEDPEEEGLEDIPIGEGAIVDE